MATSTAPLRSSLDHLTPHRVEDLGAVDDLGRLFTFRLPLLAEAINEIGSRPTVGQLLGQGSTFDHLQIIGPRSSTRDMLTTAVGHLLHRRAEVEMPWQGGNGLLSPNAVLCSLNDVVTIMLRREQNLVDERDATFPPVVLVVDRYDEVLHAASGEARERAAIVHGVGEILRGGPAVDVHLVITAAAAVDDPRFTTARTELFAF